MARPAFAREATHGTTFHADSGKLYLFRPKRIEVVLAWPKPRAWRLEPGRPWKGFHPFLPLPADLELARRLAAAAEPLERGGAPREELPSLLQEVALLRCAATVPPHVRAVISSLPVQQHWTLLRLVAACGRPALDLMEAAPALAVALGHARWFHFTRRPLRSARALLQPGRSLRALAAWLGFPGTASALHLLRKVDPESLAPGTLRHVRTILLDPSLRRRAAHLPVLSRPCTRILSDPHLEPNAGQPFLHELSREGGIEDAWILKDLLRMHDLLEGDGQVFRPVLSLRGLRRRHDALVERIRDAEMEDTPLPPPPLAGSETIEPLRTSLELQEEGRVMHHCVAGYLREVMEGKVAIYRMTAPERCTVSLRRTRGGEWGLSEVRLAHNEKPSPEALWTLQTWLADAPLLGAVPEDPDVQEDLPF